MVTGSALPARTQTKRGMPEESWGQPHPLQQPRLVNSRDTSGAAATDGEHSLDGHQRSPWQDGGHC